MEQVIDCATEIFPSKDERPGGLWAQANGPVTALLGGAADSSPSGRSIALHDSSPIRLLATPRFLCAWPGLWRKRCEARAANSGNQVWCIDEEGRDLVELAAELAGFKADA
jgi:hypothetical protein